MVQLVAKGRIELRQEVAPPDSRIAGDRGRHRTVVIDPGTVFDTAAYGLDDAAVLSLGNAAAPYEPPPARAETKSQEPDFDRMSRAEIDAYARDRGIDTSDARNKADAVEMIQAASTG